MKTLREQTLANKIRTWVAKNGYPEKNYDMIAKVRQRGADIQVREKKSKNNLVLQIETKVDMLYTAIGEAFCYYYDKDRKVPTFVAVPSKHMRTRTWDPSYIVEVFDHFKVDIGVLVLDESGKIKPLRDPLHKFT